MDERKLELERLKRVSGQAARKYVTGWKAATIIFLALALLLAPLSLVAEALDNVAAIRFGGDFWRLASEDETADYFEKTGELTEQITEQTQIEGAVLLKNENGALPLPSGAQLCCVSGDMTDAEKPEILRLALAEQGFSVMQTGDTGEFYGAVVLLSREEERENINVLTQAEKELLQTLADRKAAGKLQKLILLLNTESDILLDFLQQDTYGVDAALWIGGGAVDGAAKLLAGENPAGSAVNVWHCAAGADPASRNGVCREGIYAGYKYYETRYEDYVMGTGNAGDYAYSNVVAYPFGFGLSYTTFAYADMQVTYDQQSDCFAVTVTVTNTGTVPGRKTVQVYGQSPYTDYDRRHGVEKAAVTLVGFAKTALLQPGSSETVCVSVDRRELAAYDTYGAGTYILDAGDYYLTVADHAHDAVNHILAAKGYTADNTDGRMDAEGNAALTHKWTQSSFDDKTYDTAENGAEITNRLSAIDPVLQGETVIWLSRNDWEGTLAKSSAEIPGSDRRLEYDPGDHATVSMPTLGAKNGLKLYDMIGLAFDDLKWQTLLDQLTFAEMAQILGDAYGFTMAAESAQAPGARHAELDMPVSEALLTAAFDPELAYAVGALTGDTACSKEETVLYGFDCGFEDGFLTGKLRAAQVQGIRSRGVNVVLSGLDINILWLSEQSARERYLRGFQYAVETEPTTGMEIRGGAEEILDILRSEWGGKGMAVSHDVAAAGGVLAGITAFDSRLPVAEKELYQYENDPVIVSAMRQACHYNLYALANSAAMNGIGADTQVKTRAQFLVTLLQAAMGLCAVAAVVFGILWYRGKVKWQRTDAYRNYQAAKNPPPKEETE